MRAHEGRLRRALAAGSSLSLHLVALLALRWVGALPDVGIELELPSQVELGIVDDLRGSAASQRDAVPTAAPEPIVAARSDAPQPSAQGSTVVEPKPAASKPKKKPKRKPAVDGGVGDDPGAAQVAGESSPLLAAYAPKGAALSLRVDMDAIRSSPLTEDARALLQAIPDFQRLLDGSGVDPMDDLSRLFIASPDLRRESLVLAGKYLGGEDVPRRAVAELARARGKTATWRTRGGISTAAWENDDVTPRVLALLAPTLFAITRPDDLPRIVGIARALAARRAPRTSDAGMTGDPTEALLAMQDREVIAFAVENAKTFVRGRSDHVPERIEISIRFAADDRLEIQSRGIFLTAAEAKRANEFWDDVRQRFARHPLVALSGMSGALRELTLTVQDEELTAATSLSLDQTQRVLRLVRDALATGPGTRTQRPTAASLPTPER